MHIFVGAFFFPQIPQMGAERVQYYPKNFRDDNLNIREKQTSAKIRALCGRSICFPNPRDLREIIHIIPSSAKLKHPSSLTIT